MDIVIPLGKGSNNENIELRYCLRSIELHVSEVENIFVVGECPSFLVNVVHIPAEDAPEKIFKQRNISHKLLLACKDKRVSDRFGWFSDDHILLKPFLGHHFYNSSLEESMMNFTSHQTYRQTIINTYSMLNGGNDYCHSPMILEKDKFSRAMELADWNRPWGYAIKSLYCGLNGFHGVKYPDLKFKQAMTTAEIMAAIDNRLFFSYDDRSFNECLISFLNFLFPNKSQYEL